MYKFDPYPCALCPGNKINKTIYATFESSDAWPCADGFSAPLTLFNVQSGPGNSFVLPGISNPVTSPATYYLSEWRNRGPLVVQLLAGGGTYPGTFSRITTCNGNIYNNANSGCSGTPTSTQVWANIRYFSLNSGPQALDRCIYYLYILLSTRRLPDIFPDDPYEVGDIISFNGPSIGLNDPGRLKSFTFIGAKPCYEPWDMAFDFTGASCIFTSGRLNDTYHDLLMQNDTGIIRITE
jgi:hypothetical protein